MRRKVKNDMNNMQSEKYGIEPKVTEAFRIKFDFHRLTKVKKDAERKFRHTEKIEKTKKKLTVRLEINSRVLILGERLKKKDATGNFYKSTPQNKSFLIKIKYTLLEKDKKIAISIIIGFPKKAMKD